MKKALRIVLFAFCLVICFILGVLAASAAYEVEGDSYSSLSAAVSVVPNGGTIYLTSDETLSATTLSNDKTYTIDGNGYELSAGGTLSIAAGRVTLQNITITSSTHVVSLSGGALTINSGTELHTDYGRAIKTSGNGTLRINGGRFLTEQSGSSSYLLEFTGTTAVTVTGGSFYAPNAGYPLVIRNGSSLNISGGLFTFADTIDSQTDVNESTLYTSSYGKTKCLGLYIDTTAPVRISGGTFMSGNGEQAVKLTSTCTDVVISGGKFYGYRALNVAGKVTITGGGFYENTGSGTTSYNGHHIIDVTGASAVVNIYGGTFSSAQISAERTTANSTLRLAATGTVNIYGGHFQMTSDDARAAVINLTKAGRVNFATGSFTYDGKTVYGTGATLERRGAGSIIKFAIEGTALTFNGGTFRAYGLANVLEHHYANTLTINGGEFEALEGAKAFVIANGEATLNIKGGSFLAEGDTNDTDAIKGNAVIVRATVGHVRISAGTFTSTAGAVFEIAALKGQGSFEISGGTFVLEESEAVSGGAIIRGAVGVIPQADKGQYYDPTEMYYVAGIVPEITGGIFVDNRRGNGAIIDYSLADATMLLDGAVFLSKYPQEYAVNLNDTKGTDIPMGNVLCNYQGESYYCYYAKQAPDTTYSPTVLAGASVSITSVYEGIRFTSLISAAVAGALPEGAQYGTLIAPADYVVAAGGFTHEKLNALDAAFGTPYVDIPAINSVVVMPDGSIAFSGTLINLKTGNYQRTLAAVSYVLLDGKYYYSDYDAAQHTDTMASVTKAAYTDHTLLPDEDHMSPSLYRANAFSAYDANEQQLLQHYCGWEHTLDTVTVTPSTVITVGAGASANLQAMAEEQLNARLLALGYTVSGAEILVGNTGVAETAKALSEIEGNGYYIGAINGKIVIVGTTNALTMQALAVFIDEVLSDAVGNALILTEIIASNVKMIALNSDTPFVFSQYRDGNIWEPYYDGGYRHYSSFNFMQGSTSHLYNKEGNADLYVDYPVVAAIKLGDVLDASGYNYTFVPDNIGAQSGIHVGLTTNAIADVLVNREVGYYGYTVKNGNVYVSAYDDATLRLAKKLLEDDKEDFAVNGTYMIPAEYSVKRGGNDGFTGAFDSYTGATNGVANVASIVKKLVVDPVLAPRANTLALSGVVNVEDGALEYYYLDAKKSDFDAYCALLEGKGFDEVADARAVEGSYYAFYYNSSTKVSIYVAYSAYAHASTESLTDDTTLEKLVTPTLRAVVAQDDAERPYINHVLPQNMLRVGKTNATGVTRMVSVDIAADQFGYCYVLQLEDGSFVVLDGGGGDYNSSDAAYLYEVLVEMHGETPTAQNPIRIAAWYLSHSHGDHAGVMHSFMNKYPSGSSYHLVLERLIANVASNDEIYNSYDPNQVTANRLNARSWYRNTDGSYVQYYKVHTGQRFFIGNLEFEVLYTHEDLHPWSMMFFNNSSTVLRLTAHQTDGNGNIIVGDNTIDTVVLGDIQARASQMLRATWGDYLKADMVVTAHHGGNGAEAALYEKINAQVIWWSHTAKAAQGYMDETGTNTYVQQNVKWLKNTQWLYIIMGRSMTYSTTNSHSVRSAPGIIMDADGILGLPLRVNGLTDYELEMYADSFISYMFNAANPGGVYSYGSGYFHKTTSGSVTYSGEGLVLWRGNFRYDLPVIE